MNIITLINIRFTDLKIPYAQLYDDNAEQIPTSTFIFSSIANGGSHILSEMKTMSATVSIS